MVLLVFSKELEFLFQQGEWGGLERTESTWWASLRGSNVPGFVLGLLGRIPRVAAIFYTTALMGGTAQSSEWSNYLQQRIGHLRLAWNVLANLLVNLERQYT